MRVFSFIESGPRVASKTRRTRAPESLDVFGAAPRRLRGFCLSSTGKMRSFVVGDSAYPRSSFMLVGFSHLTSCPDEKAANKVINNARVVVENAFGRLKSRFRSLKCVECETAVAPFWIHACVILHNFIERHEGAWSGALDRDPLAAADDASPSDNPDHGKGLKLLYKIRDYIKRKRA